MTSDQIRELLRKKGATFVSIAEALEVSPTSVRRVVDGESKSRRIALTVALFLGRSVEDLWPGQYPDRYRRRTANPNTLAQLRAAAQMANAKAA